MYHETIGNESLNKTIITPAILSFLVLYTKFTGIVIDDTEFLTNEKTA